MEAAPLQQNPVYTLTITPSPLTQGGRGTITYTGPVGTVITLDWHPSGEPPTVTIGKNGTANFKVPKAATSVIASDPDGNTTSAAVGP